MEEKSAEPNHANGDVPKKIDDASPQPKYVTKVGDISEDGKRVVSYLDNPYFNYDYIIQKEWALRRENKVEQSLLRLAHCNGVEFESQKERKAPYTLTADQIDENLNSSYLEVQPDEPSPLNLGQRQIVLDFMKALSSAPLVAEATYLDLKHVEKVISDHQRVEAVVKFRKLILEKGVVEDREVEAVTGQSYQTISKWNKWYQANKQALSAWARLNFGWVDRKEDELALKPRLRRRAKGNDNTARQSVDDLRAKLLAEGAQIAEAMMKPRALRSDEVPSNGAKNNGHRRREKH